MAGHSHRSSVKNGHKPFKSRHSSKGALKNIYKGKVESENNKTGKTIKTVSKQQRKNVAKQLRQKKILESLETRKLFEGSSGAEKIITVIPLTTDVYADDIVKKLITPADLQSDDDSMSFDVATPSVNNFKVRKFKSNLKVIVPDMSDFINILDSAKIADFVVFGLSGTSEVDPQFGEQIVRALELQGIASYMGVVSNLSQVHEKEKFQLDVKQSLESYFKHFFPNEDRIYNLEKSSEASNALRTLCQKYPRQIKWRDGRGYMLAEQVDFVESDATHGQLIIEGTVRGIGFNANRLVHLPGLGDFQISKIEKISASGRKNNRQNSDLDLDIDNAFVPNDNQETLEEYAPEDLEMEEWSDEEDYSYENLTAARYDDHGFLPGREQQARKVKVPKGTSEYQSRWYLDDVIEVNEDEEVDENINDDFEMLPEQTQMDADFMMDIENEQPTAPSEYGAQTEAADEMFVDLSPEEEERQLQEYRALEKEDREFPDEIELDPSESAIERLKRYRGLKNLHNCVWDADEKDPNAPPEWKRLLRVGNYKNTKNKVVKEAIVEAQVVAGDKAKIYVNFPKFLLEKIGNPSQTVFAIYGLLHHEHKNALVNFSIQRWEEYEEPVPSTDTLIVQYGVRRIAIQPLFSSSSNSPNNVHKFERFLHQNTVSIATCIAPVDFTQSPAIFFKQSQNNPRDLEFVGHGTFLNSDHTRILAKRAILTGDPFKFHKRVVTIRYMFFRPEDVEWFKSIPLFTKSGRSGFIKESLGTHGYFKATFDGKLSAQDVVAMSLYKRMWPLPSLPWHGW